MNIRSPGIQRRFQSNLKHSGHSTQSWHGGQRPAEDPTPAQARGLQTGEGRRYGSGYTDEQVEAMAREDGNARIHAKSVWGRNTQPRGIELLHNAWRAAAGLISHDFRTQVQPLNDQMQELKPDAAASEQRVLDDLDERSEAALRLERLRQKILKAGYHLPHWQAFLVLSAGFAALVAGDWDPISTAMQVLGLSIKPLISFLPYSDPLHLAALGALMSLLILSHHSGVRLREVLNELRQRHEKQQTFREVIGRHVELLLVVGLICLIPVLLVVMGVNTIRVDYLAQRHQTGELFPFLEIQAGVFAAGVVLAMCLAHPYLREWVDTLRLDRAAQRQMQASGAQFQELIGLFNRLLGQRDGLLAQAGHHFQVSRDDVLRQAVLYVRRVVLSQPEATEEELFTKDLPTLETKIGDDLKDHLIGISQLPVLAPLTTEKVINRQEELRGQLQSLREQGAAPNTTEPTDAPGGPQREPESESAREPEAEPETLVTANGNGKGPKRPPAPPKGAVKQNGGGRR